MLVIKNEIEAARQTFFSQKAGARVHYHSFFIYRIFTLITNISKRALGSENNKKQATESVVEGGRTEMKKKKENENIKTRSL